MILTAYTGRNKDVVPSILEMYVKEGSIIADVTYGNGNFWKDVDTALYDFRPTDLMTGVDMRCLPYADGSIDVEVIDPPYIYNPSGTLKESISGSYNNNDTEGLKSNTDVLSLYTASFVEARRVLKPKTGLMVVKCQDIIESGKQCWSHILLFNMAMMLGFVPEDLFVLVQETTPAQRWEHQKHARKNHSYFWVFRRGR